MKGYEIPSMNIIAVEVEDVIRTSSDDRQPTVGDGDEI